MEIRDALSELMAGRGLGEVGAEALFSRMLEGSLDDAQIGAVLALIQARGPSVDEIVGAARVMRRHVTPTPAPDDPRRPVIDTCGTGGAPKTFNVSTAAAIVIAGARPDAASGIDRVLVAKHGNRSRTGRGSAEVLASLGVDVDAPPEVQARCLDEVGVCFCFAIRHHPATRHAAGVRQSLGVPTLFNLLGPLTNPAGARRQLLGVWDAKFVGPLAQALARLGSERAWVVHSRDGLDELSLGDETLVGSVDHGRVEMERVDPRGLGLRCATPDQLRARDVEDAAQMIRAILAGEDSAAADMTVLSAGAALLLGGAVGTLEEGIMLARASIASGSAAQALAGLARLSHERV
ncbi:MAG: anthranilate phosphoribosyltransferase [Phycisphaerales bacterium]